MVAQEEFDSLVFSEPGLDAGEALLAGLNPQQQAAVRYRGPALLIVAGAGSGKTRVLTHRIAHLMARREAWPSQILAITFTNKAAKEMKQRLDRLLGAAIESMWIKTFHSSCLMILRKEADRIGHNSNFTVYDTGDTRALLKRLIRESGADVQDLKPAYLAARISNAKNQLMDAETFARNADPKNPKERIVSELFSQYETELRRNNAFDFDDLITETVYLFRAHPDVAARYQRRFRHILVDEYQDTNQAQYALIRELTKPLPEAFNQPDAKTGELLRPATLTVVGDADQSIYAFRGADIRNIREFGKDFAGAETILLEQNYRSTQNILSGANAVISKNFDRPDKNLWTDAGSGDLITLCTATDERAEAAFVVDSIAKLHTQGRAYRDVVVLYRTNALSPSLEQELKVQRIPYQVIGGLKFFERKEVKDALAYLTAISNPANDEAVRRVLNLPSRGIGEKTELKLAEYARSHGMSFREALDRVAELGLGPKLTAAIEGFSQLLHQLAAMEQTAKLADLLQFALGSSGYRAELENSRDPQDQARLENLDALVGQLIEYQRQNPDTTLADYLAEITLAADADEISDDSGAVSLMTLHTAKGLEYPVVFIIGLEQGTLPHIRAFSEPGGLSEERRLMYVGMTRAEQKLYLSSALQRTLFGSTQSFLPSSFLTDIPRELLEEVSAGSAYVGLGGYGGGYGALGGGSGFGGGSSRYGGSRSGSASPAASQTSAAPSSASGRSVTGAGLTTVREVRDNSGLVLAVNDRVRHSDFGEGLVLTVRGEGKKAVAEVVFDSGARKTLVVNIAPIEKL